MMNLHIQVSEHKPEHIYPVLAVPCVFLCLIVSLLVCLFVDLFVCAACMLVSLCVIMQWEMERNGNEQK